MTRRLLAAALGVAAALAAACANKADQPANAAFRPLGVGAAVPEYAVRSLAGDTVRLGGAEQPTVLNVWATWCTSCREEMASLDSLQREFGARGVRVVGVSVDQGDDARVQRFAASNRLAFTVAHDPAATIQQLYQVVGVPTTFVVGADGKLLWQHTGNISDSFDEVRGVVRRAVGAARGGAGAGS